MNDERDGKLVLDAEAALRTASLREPDWEALAERIDGALGAAGTTDDALLLPPLPESTEDGQEPLAAPAPPGEPTSLAELARAAVARRGAKEAVDLAKESLAIASQGRGAEPAVPAAPAPTIVVDREDSTFPSARRKRAVERAAAERAALDTRGPWIGVAIAAVGLAAGFGLYLASKRTQIVEVPVVQTVAPAAATQNAAPPNATPAPEAPPRPAKVAAEAPPDALPAEPGAQPPAAANGALALGEKSAKPSAPAGPARGAAAGNARPEKVVLEEAHPAKAATAGAAPKPADSVALRPAELNSNGGGMADRPSTGAAQAAVGAVLGAARACIAGQPEASSATLTFGSSGEVTSVSVSGGAEGTPAAACIKGALGKARVQPFAAPSFSLGVTVRPL